MTGQIASQPTNRNFLSPHGFKLAIKRLPNVNYFSQTVTIPQISLPTAVYENPLGTINFPGAKLRYEALTIRFKVDEDLKNYREIYNWLTGLGHPESFDQTKQLSIDNAMHKTQIGRNSTFVSDGSLLILTSHKNENVIVRFIDMFPVSLSELTFDSTDPDVHYLEATASFAYTRFIFE